MSRNKKNADQDLKSLLGNWGFAFEVLRVLVNAMMAIGGKIEHLKRLLNEPKLVEQIARLIVPLEVVIAKFESVVTEAGEVLVDYVLPAFSVLQDWFSGYLHPSFKNAVFEPIKSCLGVTRNRSKVRFVLVHLKKSATNDEVLAELDRLGLRPAFHTELYSYSRANPTAGQEFPIAALGDTTLVGGNLLVAVLGRHVDGRALVLFWVAGDWDGNYRFLAVRK